MEATRREMSLQDFVEQAVEYSLGNGAPCQSVAAPIAGRIAALPERSRKLVTKFVDLLEVAPGFYVQAIEKHVSGLLSVFRQFGKKYFEKAELAPRAE
jgi:hypothetical protein